MPKGDYAAFRALDPFFSVVMEGLSKFVDGEHYLDTLDDDLLFEFRYDFPGWPQVTRGRANLVTLYARYGNSIRLDRGDALITHPSENGRVVTLEYEVHGKILATDTPYDNRFVSIATIENRKIVRWRDYMDSLAAVCCMAACVKKRMIERLQRRAFISPPRRGAPIPANGPRRHRRWQARVASCRPCGHAVRRARQDRRPQAFSSSV
jgi:ketosteroid isomerase-like protein